MKRKVTVVLTEYEARTLLCAAGNGFGDGDLFVEEDGSSTGYGDGKRSVAAFYRAVEKLDTALERNAQ